MEQSNSPGREQHQPRMYLSGEGQEQDAERSELARQVDAAIEAARLQERGIDDLTAKRIAADIQPGSGALYDLAMTGKISEDIYAELDVAREVLPETTGTWLAALDDYCLQHSERGQVPGWADLEGAAATDEQRIYHGITEALREVRAIDHATARAIAAQLHGGQDSALYALASSGALVEGLSPELEAWRTEAPVEVEPWLDALDEYVASRANSPDPVEGWHELWPTQPGREDDEPATGDEERPPYGTEAAERAGPESDIDYEPGTDRAKTHIVATIRENAEKIARAGWPGLPATWLPISLARNVSALITAGVIRRVDITKPSNADPSRIVTHSYLALETDEPPAFPSGVVRGH